MSIEATIRPFRPRDRPFVASTWREQLPRRLDANEVINRVLAHQGTRVLCAVQPSDDETVLAWLCYTRLPMTRLIHFAYTRKPMRRMGLMRRLVDTVWPGAERHGWVHTFEGPSSKELLLLHGSRKLPLDWALDGGATKQ